MFQVGNSCRFGDNISNCDEQSRAEPRGSVLPHHRDEERESSAVLSAARQELLLPQPVPGQWLPHSPQEQSLRPDQRAQPRPRGR